MKNFASCEDNATEPPLLLSPDNSFAFWSKAWAVNMPLSKATISATCAAVGGTAACAWPSVASVAWLARLGSRPSHMVALRKPRLVDGNGRRYADTIPEVGLVRPVAGLVLQLYGSSTAVTSNSAPAGIGSPMRSSPFEVNSL